MVLRGRRAQRVAVLTVRRGRRMVSVSAMHKLKEDWTAPDFWYGAIPELQQQPRCLGRRFVADILARLGEIVSARGCGAQIDTSCSEPGLACLALRRAPPSSR